MTHNHKTLCPCCSGEMYERCCKPFHKGTAPENAVQLMRSRYAAYTLNIPEYIIETTHPASPQFSEDHRSWKESVSQFSTAFSFEKLEILDYQEKEKLATVTFTAYIRKDDQDHTFTEQSAFEKHRNRWHYLRGRPAAGRAPELVSGGELKILSLSYYGNPVLRKKADPVGGISGSIKKLASDMIATMDHCHGFGLAAPQVHQSLRLFVTRVPSPTNQNPGEVKVFINPIITFRSDEMWTAPEGCLSIPSLQADVERPKEIAVEFTDLEGNVLSQRFSDWEAKVILHENDHLDGILYIDHLEKDVREKLDPHLVNIKNRIYGED